MAKKETWSNGYSHMDYHSGAPGEESGAWFPLKNPKSMAMP